MELSKNQQQFVKKAESLGYNVDYSYSGRGMYGKTCPAVRVEYKSDFPGAERKYQVDQMGKGYVFYAQS